LTSKTIALLIFAGLTACAGSELLFDDEEEINECVLGATKPMLRHCNSARAREKFDPQKTIDAAKVAEELDAPPEGLIFRAIGPAPLRDGNLDVSGRATAIAVDPTNFEHWLIGTAAGGIFETKDAGNTFNPLTDIEGLPVFAIGAIAFAKSKPKTIYAGLGEAYETSTSYTGHGILRSDDAGQTWGLLGGKTFAGTAVTHILVDPENEARIFVTNSINTVGGISGDIERSTDPKNRGIYLSENGGITFKQIKIPGVLGSKKNVDVSSFAAHPKDFNKIIAVGTHNLGLLKNILVLVRSTDAGKSWTRKNFKLRQSRNSHSQIAISPSSPGIAYLSVGGDKYNGMWRTDNLWDKVPRWRKIRHDLTKAGRDTNFCEDQCWYNHTLSVDPNNPNILYAGGASLWKYDHSNKSWTDVGLSQELNDRIHVDQHDLEWAGKSLIVANDGGVWSTQNGGSTFNSHNKNLPTIQFWRGAISKNRKLVAGGAQDNGTSILFEASTSTDMTWKLRTGGDGFSIVFNDAGTLLITSEQEGILYPDGARIPGSPSPGKSLMCDGTTAKLRDAPFDTLLAQCPHNENILLLNGSGEVKQTYSAFNPSPPWCVFRYDKSRRHSAVSAMAYSPNNRQCAVFAFADRNGQIHATRTSGDKFFNLDPPKRNDVADFNVTDLIFTSNDANSNTMYITVAGYGQGHVYRSKCENPESGNCAEGEVTQWTNISSRIDTPHHSVVYVGRKDWLFVGTDVGALLLEDASQCAGTTGCKWRHFGLGQGLPYVAVQDLQIDEAEKILVAFTHGRSAYKLEIN